MRTILCYGDSNTWGYIPGSGERYLRSIRWTGRLQQLLGDGYYVIEEGLNGRTTVWDDPVEEFKNGRRQLIPILQSHKPLDLVVLMLGTNDLKSRYHVPMFDIQLSIMQLIRIIQQSDTGTQKGAPQLLLVAPPLVEGLSAFKELFEKAEERSKKFSSAFRQAAESTGCLMLDAAEIVRPSPVDGVHLSPESHMLLAEHLAQYIQELFPKKGEG